MLEYIYCVIVYNFNFRYEYFKDFWCLLKIVKIYYYFFVD